MEPEKLTQRDWQIVVALVAVALLAARLMEELLFT
jgi:hypothetical protein